MDRQFIKCGEFAAGGELGQRLAMSFDRLEDPFYHGDSIFDATLKDNPEWPGDWEGRTLLAVVMLARATGRKPATLDGLMTELAVRLNRDGYMGPLIAGGVINEQQLAGNSWVLRGLCELYEWKEEPAVLAMIRAMVKGLILPTRDTYEAYPLDRASRRQGEGREAGNLTGEAADGWLSSTDIGCAFIMLDGASHAYRLCPDEGLRAVLTGMIRRFSQADLMDSAFQTHATLSAIRGILRFYEDTGEAWLLELAADRFGYYTECGMTENFANYNWFGRPEWTEPCAIVDSFMAAAQLWRCTGEAAYLETAHKILYNALYYAQRHNGGFGCDICCGAYEPVLHPTGEGSYEAWWCCTMRGAEGLACAARYAAALGDGGRLYLPFYHSGRLAAGGMTVQVTAEYPRGGQVRLEIGGEPDGTVRELALYLPPWCGGYRLNTGQTAAVRDGFLILSAAWKAGDVVELVLDTPLYAAPARSPAFRGRQVLYCGPQLLVRAANSGLRPMPDVRSLKPAGGARFADPDGEWYFPAADMTFRPREDILNTSLQVLYEA